MHGAAEMPPDFDARRSALRRHYRYLIWNDRLPNLWWRRWAWHLSDRLDLDAMQAAADQLARDARFRELPGAPRAGAGGAGRRSGRSSGQPGGGTVTLIGFEITANAFLRHMVRGIVGTLVEVGRGDSNRHNSATILEAARSAPSRPERSAARADPDGRGVPGAV